MCWSLFLWKLWVQNFSTWVFRGSKFFLVGISWIQLFFTWLTSWFKDFQLLAAWERVTENRNTEINLKLRILIYIDFNNCQLFILKECFIYQTIHYYAAFIHTNCILFFRIRISLLVTAIDSNCKTTCFIVSLIIYFSWLLILRIPLLVKTLTVFFFMLRSIERLKSLSFRGSAHPPNSQFSGVMLTGWRSFVTNKEDR